jgi:hypothetical protein
MFMNVANRVQAAYVMAALLACAQAQAQQRCELGATFESTPTERFEDNGDGTVTDRQSKLMWTRCSAGQKWTSGSCSGTAGSYAWSAAEQVVTEVNLTGTYFYSDWRVPQLRELSTLVERRCSNPRVNLTLFPNTPPGVYWTATSRPGTRDLGFAYVLDFGTEGIDYRAKEQQSHVRLVRRAQ